MVLGIGSGVIISGRGMSVPSTVVGNEEVIETLREHIEDEKLRKKLTPDWPLRTIGIKSRRRADPAKGETATSLTACAAVEALNKRGASLEDIDCIISVTSGTADNDAIPQLAGAVHERLREHYGAPEHTTPVFDLNSGCSGMLYGMAVAYSMISTGLCTRVLLTATDLIFSRRSNPADAETYQVFGDGSSAFVLERTGHPARTNGTRNGILLGGILLNGFGNTKTLRCENGYVLMDKGKDVYRFAVKKAEGEIPAMLKRLGIPLASIDHFLFHQANDTINAAIMKRLGIKPKKCYSNIRYYGNTACASVGLLLCEVADRFKPGDTVLFYAAGAGLAWAVIVMRWGTVQGMLLEKQARA